MFCLAEPERSIRSLPEADTAMGMDPAGLLAGTVRRTQQSAAGVHLLLALLTRPERGRSFAIGPPWWGLPLLHVALVSGMPEAVGNTPIETAETALDIIH
jgi:hypothetical protein